MQVTSPLHWWKYRSAHALWCLDKGEELLLDEHYVRADGVIHRLIGLLGYKPSCVLEEQIKISGIVLPHCSAVHTYGMNIALDIAFLDADQQVIFVAYHVPPGVRISCASASLVIEHVVRQQESVWHVRPGMSVRFTHA